MGCGEGRWGWQMKTGYGEPSVGGGAHAQPKPTYDLRNEARHEQVSNASGRDEAGQAAHWMCGGEPAVVTGWSRENPCNRRKDHLVVAKRSKGRRTAEYAEDGWQGDLPKPYEIWPNCTRESGIQRCGVLARGVGRMTRRRPSGGA